MSPLRLSAILDGNRLVYENSETRG